MKLLRIIFSFVIVTTVMSGLTTIVYAAPETSQKVGPQTIPCVPNLPCVTQETQKTAEKTRSYILDTFGTTFLTGFLGLAGITSVIFIIVGGVQLHLAFGNEEALGKAKKTLIWAIAGLVICILSVAIVSIISKINL